MDATVNTLLIAISQISATLTGLAFVAFSFYFKTPDKIKENANTPFSFMFTNLFSPTILSLLAVLNPQTTKLLIYAQPILFNLASMIALVTIKKRRLSHYILFLMPLILFIILLSINEQTQPSVILVAISLFQILVSTNQVWVIFRNL